MAKKTGKKSAKKTAYTKPALREKIKNKVLKSAKGGRPGQWSARKAQLVTAEYEKEGGTYTGERTDAQEHLKNWGDEKWHTKTGKKAVHGKTTSRYLPDQAWENLSDAEKQKTERKKIAGSRRGKQFVKNTKKAAAAGKKARAKT